MDVADYDKESARPDVWTPEQEVLDEYNAKLIPNGEIRNFCVEFENEEDATLFLLRWA